MLYMQMIFTNVSIVVFPIILVFAVATLSDHLVYAVKRVMRI